jgi:hypothetical protein
MNCKYCDTVHPKKEIGNPHYCIARMEEAKEKLEDGIERLTKKNKVLEIKCRASLANNLCPDHRDKQAGKPCLACEISRLTKERDALHKLPSNFRIEIQDGRYTILNFDVLGAPQREKWGNLSGLPRAILELMAEMEEK